MSAQILAELAMPLGECPRWHRHERAWYWVDITGKTLYRLAANRTEPQAQHFAFEPACFAFTDAGHIVLSSSQGLWYLPEFGAAPEAMTDPEADQPQQRFNDGTVLPNGDLIIGSIGNGQDASGVRYRFRITGSGVVTTELERGYRIINSQCCSPDGQWCYVTDTPEQIIFRQVIGADGELGQKEVFYRCESDENPDGAATDIEGNLWVAMYGSSKVVVLTPEGDKRQEISVPAKQPTMVAFGGQGNRQLLITTARQGLPDNAGAANGSVLIMDSGTQGSDVSTCPNPSLR